MRELPRQLRLWFRLSESCSRRADESIEIGAAGQSFRSQRRRRAIKFALSPIPKALRQPRCKSGGPACRPTILICPFARDDGGRSPPTGYLVGSAEGKAGVHAISDQEQRHGK